MRGRGIETRLVRGFQVSEENVRHEVQPVARECTGGCVVATTRPLPEPIESPRLLWVTRTRIQKKKAAEKFNITSKLVKVPQLSGSTAYIYTVRPRLMSGVGTSTSVAN